ncbi:MAG: peroxide stress protein YaaA [Bacteroidota bacterium]
MKLLLSPAKTMRAAEGLNTQRPFFQAEAIELMLVLQKLSKKRIKTFYKVSDQLTTEIEQAHQHWMNAKLQPAVASFAGEAFKSLSCETLAAKSAGYCYENLYLFSGLYGILKASDGIAPYRLDLNQRLDKPVAFRSLLKFWSPKIASFLHQNLEPTEWLLNLASEEYAALIQDPLLLQRMVSVHFKEQKGEKLQAVSVFSKQARGLMARYCAMHQIEHIEAIKQFNEAGYRFQAQLSGPHDYVFTR